MRLFRLLELIWHTPWLLALLIVLAIIATVAWVKNQIDETNAGEALRARDRSRGDSLFKDL